MSNVLGLVFGFGKRTHFGSSVRRMPLVKKKMEESGWNIMYFLFQIFFMCNLGMYYVKI